MVRKGMTAALLSALLLLCGLLCACGEPKPEPEPTVDFLGQELPESTESVSAVLEEEQLALLEQFPQLRNADLDGSRCYAAILRWAQAHPQVDVHYTVALPDETELPWDSESLDLSAMSAEQAEEALTLLDALPKLRELSLGSALSPEELLALREERPELSLRWTTEFLDQKLEPETRALDLSALQPEALGTAETLLRLLPELETVRLGEEESCALDWEQLGELRRAAPEDAAFDYTFDFYGQTHSLEDREIDLTRVRVRDDGELVFRVLPCMPRLEQLIMDSCGLDNERMAEIRDAFPQTEVVWRIWFAWSYTARTNVEKILASNPSKGGIVFDDDAAVLQYCTKLKYLDLGHNGEIHDLSFLRYMPDLEVLIVAMNSLDGDISALADCPHLEYLELFFSDITDLSPLAELHELKHLNIGMCEKLTDITPLYGLTQLERLYIGCLDPIPEEQLEEIRRLLPDCEIDTRSWDTSIGRWRYTSDYDEDPDYMSKDYYRPGLAPRFALLRQQFGYDKLEYSFAWLDPTYVWY